MKKVMIDGTPYSASNERKATQLDTLTGEEFKTLIEQLSPDGKINTIPELIDFLNGIPEGMTLQEYIAEHGVDPEQLEQVVNDAVDDAMAENARRAYDAENEKLYLFGRPKEQDAGYDVSADDGEDDI